MVLRFENISNILSGTSSVVKFLQIAAQQLQEYHPRHKTTTKLNTYNYHILVSMTISYCQKSDIVSDSGLKKADKVELRFGLWQGNLIKFANK